MAAKKDCWAEWLAERRFGGDVEVKREFVKKLEQRRDDVLDRSGLSDGEALLDVGCGEGLIGFGALERGAGLVVFSDMSQDVLDFCREAAESLGVTDRCQFVLASADDLSALESEAIDVVTTRSVLIYVENKAAAFNEFRRVLRPGGRISLYEPINSFAFPEPPNLLFGYDVTPVLEIVEKLRSVYYAIQPPDTDPMVNFDERDLFRLCEDAGFFPVNLLLHCESTPPEPRRWESFLAMAGNPKIPTLAEAMEEALSADERERLAAHLRSLVETGQGAWRMSHAFLWATKPSS